MSKEYDDYLKSHIDAVRNAVDWMVENNVGDVRNLRRGLVAARLVSNARAHDESKFLVEEYDAYDAYFYGERDEGAFDRAWLHHIHNNPHHWQYWLLFEDENDGKPKPLEMPKAHALEMIADWWSFSWRSGNLREVFRWYGENRDRIILHPGTRKYVESVLAEIQQKLDAQAERLRGDAE